MDAVFKALADPTRRGLLDRRYERDGQSLKSLEEGLEMTRFGVMKHLRLHEGAGLVTTRKRGRENRVASSGASSPLRDGVRLEHRHDSARRDLPDATCKTIEQMRLVNVVCRLAEGG